jgi:hypothetical protein
MTSNRLGADATTYRRQLAESANILDWVLDQAAHENAHKCRHELGLVGGTAVSHVQGNLVDLDSELRGQTRFLSKCAARQHTMVDRTVDPFPLIRNDKTPPIDTRAQHLRACQMFAYPSVPLPPSIPSHVFW